MSASVSSTEHRARGLFRGHEPTAWADRVAVSFSGFPTAEEAHRAAVSAFDALRVWLARQRRSEPVRGRGRVLRKTHDGERWHLALDGVSIGGIIEPDDPRADGTGGYGFELLLPPGLGPDAAHRATRVAAGAIERRVHVETLVSARAS